MKYAIQIWLFTVIISPLILTIILGIIINDSELNEILNSYEMLLIMILFGLVLSTPAMAVFWLIQRKLNPNVSMWKNKIILSLYSFLSVWLTFYIVDNGFITRWSEQTIWVLIYSLTISIGVWIFKFPKKKIIE